MNVLLCTLNAKYSHTALGIRSMAAYANSQEVDLAEYTINQTREQILRDIFRRQPDCIGFSCYIWNITMILDLASLVKKVLPGVQIFLGGPEVSYDSERILAQNSAIDFILQGEGEVPFRLLVEGVSLKNIPGVVTRSFYNPPGAPLTLDEIPFVYVETAGLEHKILYYESQRGCPFSCQYCLSSVESGIRYLSPGRVEADLQFFLDKQVRQVKFIDRTFNCNKAHAIHIWKYLMDHDNGVTNFHMELAADLLDADMLSLLKTARKGLFQFEIGVQSTHPPTLDAIQRTGSFASIAKAVSQVKSWGNIHQHLDLIAGLPYEGYQTFSKSFDDVYRLGMEQLQLGFLKLLKGSGLREQAEAYGIIYSDAPPYEVLSTGDLTYGELLRLKNTEDMVETFYNSKKAPHTLAYAIGIYQSPFRLYEALGDYWEQAGYFEQQHSREGLYTCFYAFCTQDDRLSPFLPQLQNLLLLDMHLAEKCSRLPHWLSQPEDEGWKAKKRTFFQEEANTERYLPHLRSYTPAQRSRMCQILQFEYSVLGLVEEKPTALLFDYHAPSGETTLHQLEDFL